MEVAISIIPYYGVCLFFVSILTILYFTETLTTGLYISSLALVALTYVYSSGYFLSQTNWFFLQMTTYQMPLTEYYAEFPDLGLFNIVAILFPAIMVYFFSASKEHY